MLLMSWSFVEYLQESTRDSITLLPDVKEHVVQELAQQLGLYRVGWIFTDLVADDVKKGTVSMN